MRNSSYLALVDLRDASRCTGLIGAILLALGAPLPIAHFAAAQPSAGSSLISSGATLEIVVLSNFRADLVSGGDALIELRLPRGADPKTATVMLNGRDVTSQFAVRANGRFQGLLKGLIDGENILTAELRGGPFATMTLTNHPKQGPIFSGPQVEPYVCDTELLGLGPSSPPICEAPTKFEYFYKRKGSDTTDPFLPYNPASPPPASEVATTITDQGKSVPFIVRRERGVINRGIYDIAVLYQPGQDWQPWSPQAGWNGKLFMVFNGSTKAWHRQSIDGGMGAGVLSTDSRNTLTGGDIPLARGFAVATSTISQVNNAVTSAETAMMLKEHLIETYGPVRYTMSIGASGGAMMQHLIAQNYPGLLDGLIPMMPLPDMWTAILGHAATDYPLLGRYFNQVSPLLWSDKAARMAVYGGADADADIRITSGGAFHWWQPTNMCTVRPENVFDPASQAAASAAEPAWVYDSVRNPTGVRCAMQDYNQQIFGTRPKSAWGPVERSIDRGFATRPVDNVGVQYGLEALKRGEITPEQFVDLNQKIGGIDIDGAWSPKRMEADPAGLRNLYRTGQINGGFGLADVPMVHVHTFSPTDLYHPLVATEMVRRRLIAVNGTADNLVKFITVDGQTATGTATTNLMRREAFLRLDKWLAAIEKDRTSAPTGEKVLRNKPAEAADICWTDGQPGAKCPEMFLYPKMVAGSPIAADVQKCQLKPINWNDYGPVRFTPVQKRRLQQTFPKGVCDWSKPGVEQQPPAGVWRTYADTVGGRPLGPAPMSRSAGDQAKPVAEQSESSDRYLQAY